MKTFFNFLVSQLCCLSLIATDTLAKGDNRRDSTGSRPNVHKSSGGNRNPITGSKNSKPAPRPAAKPANVSRPQAKPAERPRPQERPQAKPAERPNRPESRPAERPNRPETRPAERPNQPENRPGERPNRPENRPNERPNLPDNRPGNRPGNRPEDRPGRPETKPAERPNRPDKPHQRPETLPGEVTYPRPNRPGNNRPDQKPNVRPGQNTKPVKRPVFDNDRVGNNSGNNSGNHSNNKNWWSSNKNSNNRTTIVNNKNVYRGDKNIQINNNFQKNVNWSTNQKNWGYNPWWNRPATRPWYGGSWNHGWSNHYYHSHNYYHGHYWGGYRPLPGYVVYDHDDNDVAQAIGWGLVGWGLGKLIFDSGYQTYSNPYPAQPVQSSKGAEVTYTQPITVVAAQTAPAASEDVEKATEASESFITESQEAFKQRNYLKALESANKAVAEAPGDGALHEYRALVLFALGKYSEAAGVLNPVLAGGPGWDWSTMISLYDSQQTYTTQLESLEAYSKSKPDAADARFLLGYHYMVCGHLDQASSEFSEAAKLQPKDSVSAQLRDLTAASSDNGDEDAAAPAEAPDTATPPPAPVPLEKLTGTWVSNRGDQGTVTLAFKDDGKFIWTFKNDKATNEFGGDYSMNDNGLLVLDADESQMVASVALPESNQLKFVLAGGPPGDPGMTFAKQ